MNRQISLGLTMLAGIAIGAVAVQALHAQAKPKAYSVTEIEVLDAAPSACPTGAVGGSQGRPFSFSGMDITASTIIPTAAFKSCGNLVV